MSEKVSWSGHARSGVEGLAASRRQSGDHDEGLEALQCLSSPARRRSLACWKGDFASCQRGDPGWCCLPFGGEEMGWGRGWVGEGGLYVEDSLPTKGCLFSGTLRTTTFLFGSHVKGCVHA